ncbi:kinase-like domain-containing protein [Amylocarpus encephaloides]|uniref:Kinase-like domain-containing protein n=1 Tax=Amylocarpus encephaloides TaxID=45428 RepID=A0A9P7YK22_9HELO|nr:kinase-like domain-containing protein [Amylocarpus encephaloides]
MSRLLLGAFTSHVAPMSRPIYNGMNRFSPTHFATSSLSLRARHACQTTAAKLPRTPLEPLLDHPSWHFSEPLKDYHTSFEIESYSLNDLGHFATNLLPVHLGKTFKEGRYQIIHSLGIGSRSTVWLARDRVQRSYVALKILVSTYLQDYGPEADRFKIHNRLQRAQGSGVQRVCPILDRFTTKGHLCQVLPLAGPVLREGFGIITRDGKNRKLFRTLFHQTVEAVAFLHENGVVHGNLNPQKIMFRIRTPHHLSLEEIYELVGEPEIYLPGERTNDKYFRYVVKPAILYSLSVVPQILLAGLSGAFLANQARPNKLSDDEAHMSPLQYIAPEVVQGSPPSFSSDVWSIAPALWDGVIGYEALFAPGMFKSLSKSEVLHNMRCRLGDLPTDCDVESGCNLMLLEDLISEKISDYENSEDFGDDDDDYDEDLTNRLRFLPRVLRLILELDPNERPTAKELAQDSWFDVHNKGE